MKRELAARALARGEPLRLAVTGRCMEPLLADGDWAWFDPIDAPLRPGDVVLAQTSGGDVVCHRVLACSERSVLSAGDRSLVPYEHRPGEVWGRLRAVERDGRRKAFRRRALDGLLARAQLAAGRLRGPLAGRLLNRVRWELRTLASAIQ